MRESTAPNSTGKFCLGAVPHAVPGTNAERLSSRWGRSSTSRLRAWQLEAQSGRLFLRGDCGTQVIVCGRCVRGQSITRVAVALEAGRDGFWLARWLAEHGIEAHIIHSGSVAVSREHRRAKTDRLDTIMLIRVFLGGLRGERGHCAMVAVPSLEEEYAKRPGRERENLVGERTRIINRVKAALTRLGIRGFNPSAPRH